MAVWLSDSHIAAEIDAEVLAVLKETVEKLRGTGLEIDMEVHPDIDIWEDMQLHSKIRNDLIAGL